MATSRVPATIDALVAAFTGAGLHTFDGAPVTGDYTAAVFVGYDGAGEDSDFRAVTSTQAWANLGAKVRTEEFDVTCAINTVVGDSNGVGAARITAYDMLATVENTLRQDPSLAQPPPFVAELGTHDLFSAPTSSGAECRIVFTVHVKTRV